MVIPVRAFVPFNLPAGHIIRYRRFPVAIPLENHHQGLDTLGWWQ